ncbi:hypothetical protein HY798_04650 [Candidatus Falkowbacteria bacterium]|nr:hypothetical protein [Candidatus Falkowbacteria bacterium]
MNGVASYIYKTAVVFIVLAGVCAGGYFVFIRRGDDLVEGLPSSSAVHYYKNSTLSLSKIRIKAVYFVPNDKGGDIFSQWQSALPQTLEDIVRFHKVIFKDLSQVSFDIYPQPIIGREDSSFYDTETTGRGNPAALRNVYRELEARLLTYGGDLFDESFVGSASGEYIVYCVLYEGVGASASENVIFLSSSYLTNERYQESGATIFYHEFAHTLGIPDHYDEQDGKSSSLDIMGFGLVRPLAFNYLDEEILEEMGL